MNPADRLTQLIESGEAKSIRQQAGHSLTVVAAMLSIPELELSPAKVKAWETGRTMPGPIYLEAYLDYLDDAKENPASLQDKPDIPAMRHRRMALGLSHARLAEAASISPITLQNWEGGKTNPNPELFSKVLDALDKEERKTAELAAKIRQTFSSNWKTAPEPAPEPAPAPTKYGPGSWQPKI